MAINITLTPNADGSAAGGVDYTPPLYATAGGTNPAVFAHLYQYGNFYSLLPDLSASVSSINSFAVYCTLRVHMGAVQTTEAGRILLNSGYAGSTISPPRTFTAQSYSWATNPATGVAWTSSDINGLGIGFIQDDGSGLSGSDFAGGFDLYYLYGVANVVLLTPVVTTGSTTSITSSGAVLNGVLNANGLQSDYPAYYYFQYGLTTSYGSYSPNSTGTGPYTGSANNNVTATLSSLSPNTLYHYRIVGYSYGGDTIAYGSDATFTTLSGETPIMVF